MNDTFYIKIEGLTRHQIESVVGIIECSEEVSSIEILS
jgi:hypothetical protein